MRTFDKMLEIQFRSWGDEGECTYACHRGFTQAEAESILRKWQSKKRSAEAVVTKDRRLPPPRPIRQKYHSFEEWRANTLLGEKTFPPSAR